jgi:hypothetical protein
VKPFRIEVSEADLRDLRQRLKQTRWPEPETVKDWSQGVSLAYLRELCRYWGEGYDWRATEARLNAFPQFRTVIEAWDPLHIRSPHRGLPLVIARWRGSIIEFLVFGRSPTLLRTVARRLTPSTSSARRYQATALAINRRSRAGASSGSLPLGSS